MRLSFLKIQAAPVATSGIPGRKRQSAASGPPPVGACGRRHHGFQLSVIQAASVATSEKAAGEDPLGYSEAASAAPRTLKGPLRS